MFHPEVLRGSHRVGASNKGGVGKISSFLSLSANILKTVADTAKVTIKLSKLSIDTKIDDLGISLGISRHFSCFGDNNS